MSISKFKLTGFIPSTDLDVANRFYSGLLGLKPICKDEYAIEYELYEAKLRVTKVSKAVKANHTILGWAVTDINAVVQDLKTKGINFLLYKDIPQDETGIATFPNGGKVVWFKDPDENILSLTQ